MSWSTPVSAGSSRPSRSALGGSGRGLVHGFPRTGAIRSGVAEALCRRHRVVVPDLRGFGGSTLTTDGADGGTLSRDLEDLVEAVGGGPAAVVVLDAGVPPTFLLAMRRPDLLRRVVLMEATLGPLPGAEAFGAPPPWWFGFHQVPGLAERVLARHEAEYVGWFYGTSTAPAGRAPAAARRPRRAFARSVALRCALVFYRAMPETARQLSAADTALGSPVTVPTPRGCGWTAGVVVVHSDSR